MCSMKTLIRIALGIAAALATGYLLFPEYRQSIATAAPYLVLLACPLMMLLMMGGHRGSKDDEK